ncbi:hypothetical protein ASD65_00885 [Microbacterium sp. Root61]|uniref:DUF4129 domain-containing protein n=1 Tax=Microbacterium sp. Root61 TaxID=1736570 RepID=UPI0006F4BC57|nr:DUF4129 domain-containing protein [Microbacterium sp. Root61]KRA23131.1 hypothetical protein ASD65_00885 [Microbacterium sp. Root61]
MDAANRPGRGGLALVIGLGIVTVAGIALAGPLQWSAPDWTLPQTEVTLPPAPMATGEEFSPPPEPDRAVPVPTDIPQWVMVVLVVVVVTLLAAGAYLLWRRLRGIERSHEPSVRLEVGADVSAAEPDVAPAVRRGIERALDILDEEREPADAVVQAWLGLEDAASASGAARSAAETPAEYAARIVGRFDADQAAVEQLLTLYQDVRFGAHPADAASVDTARRSLVRLRASWQQSAGLPG